MLLVYGNAQPGHSVNGRDGEHVQPANVLKIRFTGEVDVGVEGHGDIWD